MENKPKRTLISWQAPEYKHRPKSHDWYWSLGIISVASAIAAIIFGNFLFAIVIILGSITLSMYARRAPSMISFSVDDKGIRVDNTLYPFYSLDSFWIDDEDRFLILESTRLLSPFIILPIPDELDGEEIRHHLTEVIEEKEHAIPASQRIADFFGF